YYDVLEMLQPSAVVHAACWSRAKDCEEQPEAARRVNVEAVAEWLETAQAWNSFPVYVSTEQVFDGCADFYAEDATPNATTAYGATKAQAEALVLAAGGAVVRLPLLLGPRIGPDRVGADQGLRDALQAGQTPSLFHDEIRSPISAAALAEPLWAITRRRIPGIFHLAGADAVSRLQLGEAVAAYDQVEPRFDAVSARDFAGPKRSLKLVLGTERAQKELGWEPPNLRQSLAWTDAPPVVREVGVRPDE
ncbi:MAG: SDR family oxidoreductase, partial [Planctomycetota bacterium]